MKKIYGYGAISEFDLDSGNDYIAKQIESFDVNPGEFIKKYELDKSGGGNIMTFGTGLVGAMWEFDNAFLVIWSCGEYIDVAVIEK